MYSVSISFMARKDWGMTGQEAQKEKKTQKKIQAINV